MRKRFLLRIPVRMKALQSRAVRVKTLTVGLDHDLNREFNRRAIRCQQPLTPSSLPQYDTWPIDHRLKYRIMSRSPGEHPNCVATAATSLRWFVPWFTRCAIDSHTIRL